MATRAGRPAARQGGVVLASVALVALLVAFIILATGMALAVKTANDHLVDEQAAYLAECRDRLAQWYAQEKQQIDGEAPPDMDEATLLANTGITPRWGLRVLASGRLFTTLAVPAGAPSHRLGYHRFALWLPGTSGADSGHWDAAGQFVPPAGQDGYRVVDGLAIEQAAMVQTLERMHVVAARLQEMFAARAKQDAALAAGRNYFRAPNCQDSATEIPCTQGFQPLQALGLDRLAGVDPVFASDAWGEPLLASNSAPAAQADTSPYSMAIEAVTPWGDAWTVMAQQGQ